MLFISTLCSYLKITWASGLQDLGAWSRKKKLMNERALPNLMYNPSEHEHCANTMSHAIMILPSIFASEYLIWNGRQKHGDRTVKESCSLSNIGTLPEDFTCNAGFNISHPAPAEFEFTSRAYGAVLIGLFFISSIYHYISWTQSLWKGRHHGCHIRRPKLNKLFHYCDRTTIYFFIAGSYTPWLMLRSLDDAIVWMEWAVWLAAACGTAYTFMFFEKYKLLDTLLYVFVALFPGLLMQLYNIKDEVNGMPELGLGGLFYLAGVLIFKCDGIIPFAHAIWHLFVACGAFTHYYGICNHLYSWQ